MRTHRLTLSLVFCLTLVACDGAATAPADGGVPDDASAASFDTPAIADTIVDAPGASSAPFRDPALATNGVRGAGGGAGSLDVYSIDYGSHLVLGWSGRRVHDGPGADLVVFENPFAFGEASVFMDPAIVEVSVDGEDWIAFPHDYRAPDETAYSSRAADWPGFAGVTPVLLNADTRPVDPFDHAAAGGDAFDLATLPDEGLGARVRAEGFAFVRIRPAPDRDNPDTGARYPRDPVANGPDIDGVIARYLAAP